MSETWRKSHNMSILINHYVCPAKYRKVLINDEVDEVLKNICLEIEKRYEIKFIEIGADKDCVLFIIQSDRCVVQNHTGSKKHNSTKSICPRTRSEEETIRKYVQEQGIEKDYKQLHYDEQLKLF